MDQPSEPVAAHAEGQAPTRAGQPGNEFSRIAQDLQIKRVQVDAVARMLDEGATVPFIARFRKDRTMGLDEPAVRQIARRVASIRTFHERKKGLLTSLSQQGRLTPALESAIQQAETPKRLDDLTLPYRQRRRSPAHAAREKGLGPIAEAIWLADPALTNLDAILEHWADPELKLDADARASALKAVRDGVVHILAEVVADTADIRSILRDILWDGGRITTARNPALAEGQGNEFKEYFAHSEFLRQFPAHKVQSLFRAEKSNAITVRIEWDHETAARVVRDFFPLHEPDQRPAPSYQGGDQGLAPPKPAVEAAPVPSVAATESPVTEGESPAPAVNETAAIEPAGESAPVAPAPAAPAPVPPAPIRERGSVLPPFAIQPVPPRGPRPDLLEQHPHSAFLNEVAADALNRLLIPALEREARRDLGQRAEELAASAMGRNLFNRLMAPPFPGKRIMGIDPGFRAGCRVAVIDERGRPLEYATIQPHAPHDKVAEAKLKIEELVRKFEVDLIAIGNSNACRPTEVLLSDLLAMFGRRRRGEPEPVPPAPVPPPAVEPPAVVDSPAPETPVSAEAPAAEAVKPSEEPSTPASSPEEAPVVFAAPSEPVAEPAAAAEAPPANLPPPPPPIDLSGLPEPKESLAFCVVSDSGIPEPEEDLRGVDAGLRLAVSIARRLQDPLTELARIEPQQLASSSYAFDTNSRVLREILADTIESAVGAAGADLNHVSPNILGRISGLNPLLAREVIARKGGLPGQRFGSREQLREVPGIDQGKFELAAGFLKVEGGGEPLDGTWIHPENYPVAKRVLTAAAVEPTDLAKPEARESVAAKLAQLDLAALHDSLRQAAHSGEFTGALPSPASLTDIVTMLAQPGRDPRLDHDAPVLRQTVLTLDQLAPGMEIRGTVLNVVEFGCFIDIGMREAGLVHISQLANRFVRNPFEYIAVGDLVRVWVLSVDRERSRVSLTMIAPGSERPRGERPPGEQQARVPRMPRGEGAPRGERGPRPDGPPRGPRREGGGRGPGPSDRPRGEDRRPRRPDDRRGPGDSRPGDKPKSILPPRGKTRKEMDAPRGRRDTNKPAEANQAGDAATPTPAPAQRKPQRAEPAKPQISEGALAGRNPLGSFAELAAFLTAKSQPDEPPPATSAGETTP